MFAPFALIGRIAEIRILGQRNASRMVPIPHTCIEMAGLWVQSNALTSTGGSFNGKTSGESPL